MSSLFGGGAVAAPPPPQPPAPMPDSESPLVKEAQRRKVADILGRGGRSSTILTGDSDFSRSSLG